MTVPSKLLEVLALDYRAAAASIPGLYLSRADYVGAGEALSQLMNGSPAGALPASPADKRPDAQASLWFIRAAQLFSKGGGDAQLVVKLRDCSKRIIHEFITEQGVGGVAMDHGGMLALEKTNGSQLDLLRLNALWYSALETMASELAGSGDRSGDHFERLAGRFRRTFAKTFWCDGHGCICSPHLRSDTSHGELPDPDQLLLTALPVSPIPKTKQRQVVQALRDRAMSTQPSMGVIIDHPTLGRVESVLHRAWLAIGLINSADNRNAVLADARAILCPFEPILNAGQGIAEFYREGRPLGEVDLLATAEVTSALQLATP